MPWITSKEGYRVLVDEDIYQQYGSLVWRSLGTDRRQQVLYRTFEKPRTVDDTGKTTRHRTTVVLHRLIAGAKPGQSVHHQRGLADCRRKHLKVYDSFEEHRAAEHRGDKRGNSISKSGRTNKVYDAGAGRKNNQPTCQHWTSTQRVQGGIRQGGRDWVLQTDGAKLKDQNGVCPSG